MSNEMKISAEQVRALRDVRGWSQEHLAEVAGLSLRTIQRVESEGRASRETRLNLAAAFDVPLGRLSPSHSKKKQQLDLGEYFYPMNFGLGTLFILMGLIMGLDPVMLVTGAALQIAGLVIYALDSVIEMRRAAGLSSKLNTVYAYGGISLLVIASMLMLLGYVVTGAVWWLPALLLATIGLAKLSWPWVQARLIGPRKESSQAVSDTD